MLSCNAQHAEINFEDTTYNFDTIYPIEFAKHYFVYKNIGENNLEIEGVSMSCGCTITYYNKEPLAPGLSDSLVVEFDNINNKGYFLKEIIIHSNALTSPDKVFIKGFAL